MKTKLNNRTGYILVGPNDPESDDNLYWSNDSWSWGKFSDATTYPKAVFTADLPLKTRAIAEISNGQVVENGVWEIATPKRSR
jgi:hypothetical protein